MNITVACVFVKANVPYTAEYVVRLRAMVTRHLDRPFRFVCLTDRPSALPADVETIQIPSPKPLPGWWSKLQLFNEAHGLTERVLYLDLDTLVVSSLAPIVDFQAPFALVPHGGSFEGKGGLKVVKRFNASVMVWDAGVNTQVFTSWTPAVAARLWGDQDHIGEQMPQAMTFPAAWFPRLSEVSGPPFPAEAKVILSKAPKNHVAAERWPWFAELWRAA